MKSEALSVMKERDFYQAKVEEQKSYIRKLEYDNAELVDLTKDSHNTMCVCEWIYFSLQHRTIL